jgi:hypothetical protein
MVEALQETKHRQIKRTDKAEASDWFYIRHATIEQAWDARKTAFKAGIFVGIFFGIGGTLVSAIFMVLDYFGVSGFLDNVTKSHVSIHLSYAGVSRTLTKG